MKYAILTENDVSKWKDQTGELYHFPSRYIKILETGTKIIYYKGSLKDKKFAKFRLSPEPHYFGLGEIGKIVKDNSSNNNNYYFGTIENYIPFTLPVVFKSKENEYFEKIPASKVQNYWRDGVREIDKLIYESIIRSSTNSESNIQTLNDNYQGSEFAFETQLTEGGKNLKFTSFYERNPKLRSQAVLIHGLNCNACGFNFEEVYGEIGKAFIHVHHVKPISSNTEKTIVNPRNDLITLCANCHAIIHRRKDNLLTFKELIDIIKKNKK